MPRPSWPSLWRNPWVIGFGLVLLTLAAYQPVWRAGFIWDDDVCIWDNPAFKGPDCLKKIWLTAATPDYFPVTYSVIWTEWLCWGTHPLGYHLVNVLLHGASAIFWWRALQRLKIPGAALAAAIFAVHPMNVESVAWAAEMKNTLAMFFYAGTVFCWVKSADAGNRRWYGLALAGFALALLSKTAVAAAPLVLMGIVWWRKGRLEWKDVGQVAPFFVISAALGLITVWFTKHYVIQWYVIRTDNFWSRLAIAGWAVWFYFYKALVPLRLMVVYPLWRADVANPLAYAPLAALAFALILCWRARERLGRWPFFALGSFVVMLLPVLGFLNIAFMRFSLVADHWAYFSILAPIAVVSAYLVRKPVLAGVVLAILTALTWNQCRMYTDIETLWETTLRQDANSWVAECELGTILRQRGQTDEAIARFERALRINPDFAKAHVNLAYALAQKGIETQAVAELEKAVELEPANPETANNLAWLLVSSRDASLRNPPKAVELAERANAISSGDKPILLHTLAAAYAADGKFPKAIETAQRGLQLAEAESNTWLTGQFLTEIQLYQAGRPLK